MKRLSKRIVLPAAVAAFTLAAPIAASNASKQLVLSDPSGPIATGATITASSSNFTLATDMGNVECDENILPMTLTSNDALADSAIATEDISMGDFLGTPGACKVTHASPTPAERVTVASSGFDWSIALKPSGVFLIKGNRKVVFRVTLLDTPQPPVCVGEASTLKMTTPVGHAGIPVPVVLTAANVKFKVTPKASFVCPREAHLNGTWTVNDANGPVSSEAR
jgi:hypothetical protein